METQGEFKEASAYKNKRGNLEPSLVNEMKVAKWVQRLGVRTQPILSTSALLRLTFERMLCG